MANDLTNLSLLYEKREDVKLKAHKQVNIKIIEINVVAKERGYKHKSRW